MSSFEKHVHFQINSFSNFQIDLINTVLYDMDGLLLDTEPLWGESMLRIARKHAIPITAQQFRETTGLRIYEVTDYWALKYPWKGAAAHDVADEILGDIIASAKQYGSVLPGVMQSLHIFREEGFRIGLASSSPSRMIEELITHFGLSSYFDIITSADAVAFGKPHPGVFLHAAQQLNVSPLQCLVLEDSLNGVIAAKSARMKVIAIPHALHFDDPRFLLADMKLRSLEYLDMEVIYSI